ncbi:hypothetical protein Nepgr_017986 [Nepenthes gracilis]|uniref:Uncharacterized protein n=1 Tax=Nepenthes gracilis TaxID=150966 RepID=A0AAD3SQG1_NEPGR|nr:hypothetical protein Nepgr_017986 [Nepenthes gracilis]
MQKPLLLLGGFATERTGSKSNGLLIMERLCCGVEFSCCQIESSLYAIFCCCYCSPAFPDEARLEVYVLAALPNK